MTASVDLGGKSAVITGVSTGIGRAMALAFAEAGADVAGIYVGDDGDAESLRTEIEALGRRHLFVNADAGDPASHRRLADNVVAQHGAINIWVNNAARLMVKPVVETTDDDWHGLLSANLHGYFYGCRAATKTMIAAGNGGRIINITSAAEILAIADLSAYVAAKAGVGGLTEVLALEVAEHGITVNAIAPGAIDTPLNAEAYTDDVRATYNARIPLGYIGDAAQVAGAALFLASDAASYVTGHELVVDGGLTINGTVGHAATSNPNSPPPAAPAS